MFERPRWRTAALWLLPLVFLVLMLLAPLLRLGGEAGAGASAAMLGSLWQDDYLRWRVVWSFLQAALTCVAALFWGLPVAWVLARYAFAGRPLGLRS